MVDYLYKATVYFDTDGVIGVDPVVEAANNADWETNGKPYALAVDDLEVLNTYFKIEWKYDEVKAAVAAGKISWSDVRYETTQQFYDIYVISTTPM